MKKILVIEDEKLVREGILELLEAEHFWAIGAENGLLGIQLAQEHCPDLIICDVMMPGLDGYGVLEVLRQQLNTVLIPFIFLTAKAEKLDFRQGMALGADDYLTKPFLSTDLLTAIATRLAKQAAQAQQYLTERHQVEELQKKMAQLKQFTEAKDNLLKNLSQELRNPLSNINMAIQMLKSASTEFQRDRYLKILQEEFDREIALLNQVSELQRFLTPENVTLLHEFNLLKGAININNSGH